MVNLVGAPSASALAHHGALPTQLLLPLVDDKAFDRNSQPDRVIKNTIQLNASVPTEVVESRALTD